MRRPAIRTLDELTDLVACRTGLYRGWSMMPDGRGPDNEPL
ncbi:hypothetical protein [Streptomyces virginiae]